MATSLQGTSVILKLGKLNSIMTKVETLKNTSVRWFVLRFHVFFFYFTYALVCINIAVWLINFAPVDFVIYSSSLSATYMSVNWVSIGSDNGLSPIWRQAIILINARLLSIRPLGTNFSQIFIKIQKFSFMKMHLKISENIICEMAAILSKGRWAKGIKNGCPCIVEIRACRVVPWLETLQGS